MAEGQSIPSVSELLKAGGHDEEGKANGPETKEEKHDERAVLPFRGGETAALTRLNEYFWKQDRLRTYLDTRNGLLGADYSTKFSPWLSTG